MQVHGHAVISITLIQKYILNTQIIYCRHVIKTKTFCTIEDNIKRNFYGHNIVCAACELRNLWCCLLPFFMVSEFVVQPWTLLIHIILSAIYIQVMNIQDHAQWTSLNVETVHVLGHLISATLKLTAKTTLTKVQIFVVGLVGKK